MDDLDQHDDAALDRLGFGVIGVGSDGTVRRYNLAAATRSGLSRWRVIGRTLDEVAGAMGAAEIADRVSRFAGTSGAGESGESGESGEPAGRARFECKLARRGHAESATVILRRGGVRADVYVCIAR